MLGSSPQSAWGVICGSGVVKGTKKDKMVRNYILVRMGANDNSYFRFQSHQEGGNLSALSRSPLMKNLDV